MPAIQQRGAQKPHQPFFAHVTGCWGLQQLLTLPSLGYFSGIGTTTSHWSASVMTGEKRRSQTSCWDSSNDLSLWGRFIPALAS